MNPVAPVTKYCIVVPLGEWLLEAKGAFFRQSGPATLRAYPGLRGRGA